MRVEETPDWQELRDAASAIKRAYAGASGLLYLMQFEAHSRARAGGVVHWARDADEANAIAVSLIRQYGGNGGGRRGH